MGFGTILRENRLRRGLKQAELAARCAMKQQRLSRLEHGLCLPTQEDLDLLSLALPEAAQTLRSCTRLSGPPGKQARAGDRLVSRLITPPRLYVRHQKVATEAWLHVARRDHPELFQTLLGKIQARVDFPEVQNHLDRTPCDSQVELFFYLRLSSA